MKTETIVPIEPSECASAASTRKADVPAAAQEASRIRPASVRFWLASLVIACVVPVWIAAGFLLYFTYQSKRALTDQRMLETARALTLVVDRDLANMQASLNDLATSNSLVSGDLPAAYRRAQSVLKSHPGADIILSDETGQELFNTFLPFGAVLPRRGSLEGVHQVFATGRPMIANVYRGAATESLKVSVDVPVFRDGKVVYDLAMAVPLDRFSTVLLQQHLPPEWVGSIFDFHHIIVARTRSAEQLVGHLAGPALRQRMSNAPEGTAEVVNLEGVPMFDSFSQSAISGWTVVIGVPQSFIRTEILRRLALTIAVTALLSLIGLGLAFLMARRIAASIQGLIAPALALGLGEPVAIGDFELAETSEVADSLSKASHLIQQRAAERERAQAARREAEDLKQLNAELKRSEAEARAAEEALRESEERFRQVVEGAPLGMYIETGGVFRYLNPSALLMFGAETPSQLIGHSFLNRVEPTAHDVVRSRVRILQEDHLPVPFIEHRYLRLDGTPFDVEATAIPFVFEANAGAIVFFREISERKQEEAKRSTLEQQLLQSQKMEAIGRLAGGIAHDFNNLLMVIQSYTEMLQESLSADADQWNSTQQIMKASERAASLTGQLLAFSRKQVFSPAVLDVNTVIAEAAKMLRRIIGEDIELQVNADESLWAVTADPDQVVQVLMNLCVNARDSMAKGGTLTITTENVTVGPGRIAGRSYVPPGDYVSLSVADTGVGIREELLDRIFEPFFTTKEVGKGTGLGLAMVYGIVKQSGGYVWVDSRPGYGATFTIYLSRATEAVTHRLPAPDVGDRSRGTETLLVVEDEDALRDVMCNYLRGLGYNVLAARSGHQALSVVGQHQSIDLLITDLVMPKMSGRELSQALSSMKPALKTIHMSGYTDDVVFQGGIHELGSTFLHKPFSLGTLACKVREILNRTEPLQ